MFIKHARLLGIDALTQDLIIHTLHQNGFLSARHCFKPMHTQREYIDCRKVGGDVAERMSREVIYLQLSDCDKAANAFMLIQSVLDESKTA